MKDPGIVLVTIARRQLVAGLFWQAFSDSADAIERTRDLGASMEFDLFARSMSAGTSMVGFCHRIPDLKPTATSLAAALVDVIGSRGLHYGGMTQPAPNWIGLFKLPTGVWWYVAVRDFAIVSGSDQIGTRGELLDRVHGDLATGGWNAVVGDPGLASEGFPSFVETDLQMLLGAVPSLGKNFRLQPVLAESKESRSVKAVLCVSLVVLAVGAGFMYWRKIHGQQSAVEERIAQQLQAPKPLPPIPLPHPWPRQVDPVTLAKACVAALRSDLPIGWELEQFDCDASGRTLHKLKRDGGFITSLPSQLPEATIDSNGDNAVIEGRIRIDSTPRDDALLAPQELLVKFYGPLQPLGLTANLQAAPPVVVPPAEPGKPAYLPADWSAYIWAVDFAELDPLLMVRLLDFAGMRAVIASHKNGTWTLKGDAYAK